jgi:hypothetical protein
MIYTEQDKNNTRLNRRLMLRFRRVLNHLDVKEIELAARNFTWSNNQDTPTPTRIDMTFCSISWEDLYNNLKVHLGPRVSFGGLMIHNYRSNLVLRVL